MKKIKYLFWLIILGLLGTLIYQNLDYFMTTMALKLDLKIASWHWTMPELQNIAYFGICFLLGLIISWFKGFLSKLKLKKEIKTKDATVTSLKEQINTLKTELEVFQHDPYIKKEKEKEEVIELPAPDLAENEKEKDNKSDSDD